MAEQLLSPNRHVVTIARRPDDTLSDTARSTGAALTQWALDLGDPPAAAARLSEWLAAQSPSDAALINNASLVSEPAPLREGDESELSAALRVGLEAPLLLTAAFLRTTAGWGTDRRVLNISSGLGRTALAGCASYCAAKAGMDHFSRSVAMDETDEPSGARIVSLAPGIIDTDMQAQMRAADPTRFPAVAIYQGFERDGKLDTPNEAARKVLAFLNRPDFGMEPVADVRD